MKINATHIKLDEIDRKILDILQSNAKITNAQLSKDIGLSPAPTLERVKKLETSGVIKSYHATLDTERVGLSVNTFVQVSLKGHNKKNIDLFINEINKIPEVIECDKVTGEDCFYVRLCFESMPKLDEILDKVSTLGDTHTSVVKSTIVKRRNVPYQIRKR